MAILNTMIRPDFYDHICTKYDISEINLPNYVSDKSYFIDSHLHNPYSIIVIIKDPINVGIWMNYEIAMRFYWINSFIIENMYEEFYKMKVIIITKEQYSDIFNIDKWSLFKLSTFWDWIKKTNRKGIEKIENNNDSLYKRNFDITFLKDLIWMDE